MTAAFGKGFTDSKGPRGDNTFQKSFQAAREAFVGVLWAQPSIAACLHRRAQGDRGHAKLALAVIGLQEQGAAGRFG